MMAQNDDKKNLPQDPDKLCKTLEVGSLILGVLLTSVQIYTTLRGDESK
ncbi:MAG: hypothetical protein GF353_04970 [Candidatus Lokiarchaeota archaeon]|nr:hypothetical protein [Candidatus Lokiarchaeota archaeon]